MYPERTEQLFKPDYDRELPIAKNDLKKIEAEVGSIDDITDAILQNERTKSYTEPSPEMIKAIETSGLHRSYKIDLILTSTGDKPAAFEGISIQDWAFGEPAPSLIDDEAEAFTTAAKTLGLHVTTVDRREEPTPEEKGSIIRYALTSRSVDTLSVLAHIVEDSVGKDQSDGYYYDERNLGKILGYPETSTQAYIQQRGVLYSSVGTTDIDAISFARYALSPENADAELNVARSWAKTIKRLSPETYTETVQYWSHVHSLEEQSNVS